MQHAIHRAITFGDAKNKVRDRTNPYSCLLCESTFQPEVFSLLPAVNGFLVCDSCYEKQEKTAARAPYTAGYLVDLLDASGIDGYAFSHGATLCVRAIGYNRQDGYFLVKQEVCDCGDGYYTMALPPDLDVKDRTALLEYEAAHPYDAASISGLFHPLLLFVQFYDVNSTTLLTHLRERTM